MNKTTAIVLALIIGLVLGYFAGREHLKHEIRTAFGAAAEGFSDGMRSVFDDDETDADRPVVGAMPEPEPAGPSAEDLYIAEYIELYDVSVEYRESMLEGRVVGALFKIRNNGDRPLDRVEVTIYFKDASGTIIAEEDFLPVLVTEYSYSGDNDPLRPGYIWQMEQGRFYAAKQVPSEWQEGSFEARITEIRFSEPDT